MNDILSLKNVSTGYTSRRSNKIVTRDINVSLRRGEIVCLLGSNGTGKSTLFRTLSSFIPPLSGEIDIDGKTVAAYSKEKLARLIGIVLTDKVSDANMTGYDIVAMGRIPHSSFLGMLTKKDDDIIKDSLRSVNADNLSQRIVATLSDGERHKIFIAKALAQQTPLVLLDEPTAFLDFRSKISLIRLLINLAHEEGKTILLSTHDIELALQAADSLWLLNEDGTFSSGSPSELTASGCLSSFVSSMGASLRENHLSYSV